ncbi:Myb-like DNA-binding domain-containing protein [Spironucleus salmonicida]|uniref:Myb-like DNA-binding domain-containing protein n=1 Tax=Spironucleus salmonicida TaxID=348837 RepID=V6LRU2_9EUKA|nr:Myb-like DNA-binding domain-containing protein [Spironucleus salmonicida]|eukprot:EST46411.1 Myb-like DNA-binding domain-containing protein [Spironucleus salmonicida]
MSAMDQEMINFENSDDLFCCANGYYAEWDHVAEFSPFIPSSHGIVLENAPCINSFKNVSYQQTQQANSSQSPAESNVDTRITFDETFQTIKKQKQQQWTKQEDYILSVLYDKYGNKQWFKVCQQMNIEFNKQRTPNQCNQRFNRVIKNGLQKGKWTVEEDYQLQKALKQCEKFKWKQIADYVGGRTDTQVRYRIKKQYPEYFNQ